MISDKMKSLTKNNSVIRAMFEEGKAMAKKYGAENVFDFSIGNPNVPAPFEVVDAIADVVNENDPLYIHGYMSNTGYESTRTAIAEKLNADFGTNFGVNNIIMSVGAAGGINVVLKTILNPGDEVLVIRPYFVDYRNYVENYGGVIVEVESDPKTFMPNLEHLAKQITAKTKAIIINTPNNPTGAIYSAETLDAMGEVLSKKEKEFGTSIYMVSDEPYRDLAYDGVEVPYVTLHYHNAIVVYSYSKSLSLPGERIGYIVVPSEIDDYEDAFVAMGIATRILGFINAPSLMQLVIEQCLDCKTDISYYDNNRKTLYNGLTELGFECVKPDGAFYLFMKAPIDDDKEFCNIAKKYNLLLVPSSSFAWPGYVRIAYCVSHEKIVNSMPRFAELAKEFGLEKK
ncbi:MAG: pyridoxal phosphate-dependent aminotransferase [Lachnospiraceae bacterium]|nr:pyridoxal phosphate-dependent aminotransferase [Lachnospiraceae bacterium]